MMISLVLPDELLKRIDGVVANFKVHSGRLYDEYSVINIFSYLEEQGPDMQRLLLTGSLGFVERFAKISMTKPNRTTVLLALIEQALSTTISSPDVFTETQIKTMLRKWKPGTNPRELMGQKT